MIECHDTSSRLLAYLFKRAFGRMEAIVGSPNNNNYFGLLELNATVDSFSCQLIQMHANRERGTCTSYLSTTICEKAVKLLGKAADGIITSEMKEAKYLSISQNSTQTLFTRTSFVSQ